MPFVSSTCGALISQKHAFRAKSLQCRRPALCFWVSPSRRRGQTVSSIRAEIVPKGKEAVKSKPQAVDSGILSRREVINQIISSSKASLVIACIACLNYVIVMGLIAHRIASSTLLGHERILLTALAVLLPDFRYVLKTYLDAVTELQRYKPPVFPFAKAKVASKHQPRPAHRATAKPDDSEHARSAEPSATEIFSNFRLIFDAELAKANTIISEKVSSVTRDMTRPLVETSNQIQQLTIGTDLTLRKNVLVAAITIFLSLLGYFASAAGEAGIGCVVVMIATLLPSAILAPRRHELLILINDSRVLLSLLGTLAAVLCAFIPLTAAYFFFGACIGLVAVRAPLYGN